VRFDLKQTAAPAIEPITLVEAKTHLRVDITDDDSLITALISAAREACEAFIHGYLITQTFELSLYEFPDDASPIKIQAEPLQSVQSLAYTDWLNAVHTMTVNTDFLVDLTEPPALVLPPNQIWPGATLWPVAPIKVEITVGFGSTEASVPFLYRAGILMAIAHWYENREAIATSGAVPKEVPMGSQWCWTLGGRYWHGRP